MLHKQENGTAMTVINVLSDFHYYYLFLHPGVSGKNAAFIMREFRVRLSRAKCIFAPVASLVLFINSSLNEPVFFLKEYIYAIRFVVR